MVDVEQWTRIDGKGRWRKMEEGRDKEEFDSWSFVGRIWFIPELWIFCFRRWRSGSFGTVNLSRDPLSCFQGEKLLQRNSVHRRRSLPMASRGVDKSTRERGFSQGYYVVYIFLFAISILKKLVYGWCLFEIHLYEI